MKDLLDFLNKSANEYLAVSNIEEILQNAGFTKLEASKKWSQIMTRALAKFFLKTDTLHLAIVFLAEKFSPNIILKENFPKNIDDFINLLPEKREETIIKLCKEYRHKCIVDSITCHINRSTKWRNKAGYLF